MAVTHDEECLPPTEFILSTIQEKRGGERKFSSPGAFIAEECEREHVDREGVHCYNCLRSVNGLFCPRCVSEQTSLPEKRRALISLRGNRTILIDDYCHHLNNADQIFSSSVESKNELESSVTRLSTIIRLKREAVDRTSERLRSVQAERCHRAKTADKLRQLVDFTKKKYSVASRPISIASLDRRRRDLAHTRQRLIADLLCSVFPIDVVSSGSSSALTSASVSSIADDFESVSAVTNILTDATLTTFLHDRWIFMGNAADVQYRLVHSCLAPDHGDYSMLKGWLFNEAASRGRTAPDEVVTYNPSLVTLDNASSNRGALGALSSLAYCAQLVNVLARICDVRLPFPLTFSDFFIDKLKESELDTAIVKLNANVAFLCCTQRMDYDSICFERPFWSLCNLSKNVRDLGYQSYFTVDARLARGFVNAEKRITWQERATVMVAESTEDWENIDEPIPEWTGAPSSPPSFSQLWSSATTSVANLFKMHN